MFREGGGVQTSVIVSTEFYKLCKQYNIKFSEALRVGISLLLAEKDIIQYDNNLNISRKIQLLQNKLTATSTELEEVKQKLE